jgi:spermidine synthase
VNAEPLELVGEAGIYRVSLDDGRSVRALFVGGVCFMNDGPEEMRDIAEVCKLARGRVLILGLGMGLLVEAMLKLPSVESVEVVELNPDVIRLIAPKVASPRVTVVQGNALSWEARDCYDLIFADIWPTVHGSYVAEIDALRERCSRWLALGGDFVAWRESAMRALAEISVLPRPT